MKRFSYSSLSTLAQCEAKWSYAYLRELAPAQEDTGRQGAGSLLHLLCAVDALDRGARHASLIVVPVTLGSIEGLELTVLDRRADGGGLRLRPAEPHGAGAALNAAATPEDLISLLAVWWPFWAAQERYADTARDIATALGCEDHRDVPGALAAFWARYARRWAAARETEHPLAVEQVWRRVIPVTSEDDDPVELTGRVDEIYYDTVRGLVTVRDHKFSGAWNHDPDHLLDLHAYQLHLGAWGLSPLTTAAGCGRVNAIAYNRGLYAAPATPVLTKGTRDKATGQWKTPPRLSKTVTRFDLLTYQNFLTSPTALEADYAPEPEILERLATAEHTSEEFFRRTLALANVRVITRHVRAAERQAQRARALTAETAMPSPGPNCSWCDYRVLCRAESYGGFPDPFLPRDWGLRHRDDPSEPGASVRDASVSADPLAADLDLPLSASIRACGDTIEFNVGHTANH